MPSRSDTQHMVYLGRWSGSIDHVVGRPPAVSLPLNPPPHPQLHAVGHHGRRAPNPSTTARATLTKSRGFSARLATTSPCGLALTRMTIFARQCHRGQGGYSHLMAKAAGRRCVLMSTSITGHGTIVTSAVSDPCRCTSRDPTIPTRDP